MATFITTRQGRIIIALLACAQIIFGAYALRTLPRSTPSKIHQDMAVVQSDASPEARLAALERLWAYDVQDHPPVEPVCVRT
jgi:hypothetical protein